MGRPRRQHEPVARCHGYEVHECIERALLAQAGLYVRAADTGLETEIEARADAQYRQPGDPRSLLRLLLRGRVHLRRPHRARGRATQRADRVRHHHRNAVHEPVPFLDSGARGQGREPGISADRRAGTARRPVRRANTLYMGLASRNARVLCGRIGNLGIHRAHWRARRS